VRRAESRVSPFVAGLISLGLMAVATYFIFAKAIPFQHHYTLRAVVSNSNLLQPRSPVRVAGVDVGQVERIGRWRNSNLAVVTMRIDDRARPVHRDAELKIRPRLFLEGNFYVDLKPGTAASPELPDGGLIPLGQTARPVQLDEVLTSLQSDVRASLAKTIRGVSDALDSAAAGQPTGAEALNRTLRTSPQSLRDSAIVGDALTGPHGRELSQAIRGFARASKALADNEQDVTALVSDFNTTLAALASRAPALKEAVALLGPTSSNARRGFAALAAALPPTRKFARDLSPGLREIPATITAADPWLAQAKPLLGPAEGGGLLADLRPASHGLGALATGTRRFLPAIDEFNRCITGVILPSGNLKVDDGPLSAGVESYKELWYSMVGMASEGAGFDGNGTFLRLTAAPGEHLIESGKTNFAGQPYFTTVAYPPLRTRPAFTGKLPPLRRDVPCFKNPVPDVNGPGSTGPADGSVPNSSFAESTR
jgi:phospholipid/cholesterol/gamma-HCH transport system substrate-binding protein